MDSGLVPGLDWLPGWFTEPIGILMALQIVTFGLALAALLVWRFRVRKVVYVVRDQAQAEAVEASEDLSAAAMIVFTDQGRVVASSGVEGEAFAPFVTETLRNLAELGMESVVEVRTWGKGVTMTVVRMMEAGSMTVYAAAIRPGTRPPKGEDVRSAIERAFGDVLRQEVRA
jgi:hypothetical protein